MKLLLNVMSMSLLILVLDMPTKTIGQIISKKADGRVIRIRVKNAKRSVSNVSMDIIWIVIMSVLCFQNFALLLTKKVNAPHVRKDTILIKQQAIVSFLSL